MTDESFASESAFETELTAQVDQVFEHMKKTSIMVSGDDGMNQITLLSELRRFVSLYSDGDNVEIQRAIRELISEGGMTAEILVRSDPHALVEMLKGIMGNAERSWQQRKMDKVGFDRSGEVFKK
jgi:hypothetical protein